MSMQGGKGAAAEFVSALCARVASLRLDERKPVAAAATAEAGGGDDDWVAVGEATEGLVGVTRTSAALRSELGKSSELLCCLVAVLASVEAAVIAKHGWSEELLARSTSVFCLLRNLSAGGAVSQRAICGTGELVPLVARILELGCRTPTASTEDDGELQHLLFLRAGAQFLGNLCVQNPDAQALVWRVLVVDQGKGCATSAARDGHGFWLEQALRHRDAKVRAQIMLAIAVSIS